jgi:hypothetical protein
LAAKFVMPKCRNFLLPKSLAINCHPRHLIRNVNAVFSTHGTPSIKAVPFFPAHGISGTPFVSIPAAFLLLTTTIVKASPSCLASSSSSWTA